jgi:hypothetical protein
MKYSVIDQNFFRKDELRVRLENAGNDELFVVTDEALIEMLKSPQWQSTAKHSLKFLAEHPAKVVKTSSLDKLLNKELKSKTPIATVLCSEGEKSFRELIVELGKGVSGPAVEYAKKNLPPAVSNLSQNQLNHVENQKALLSVTKAIRPLVKSKAFKSLADHEKESVRNGVAKVLAAEAVIPILQEHGFSEVESDAFLSSLPCILRLNIGLYLKAFKWAENGGLESLPIEKFTNEIMDMRYAVISTYCDAILTEEKSVSDLREAVLKVR